VCCDFERARFYRPLSSRKQVIDSEWRIQLARRMARAGMRQRPYNSHALERRGLRHPHLKKPKAGTRKLRRPAMIVLLFFRSRFTKGGGGGVRNFRRQQKRKRLSGNVSRSQRSILKGFWPSVGLERVEA